MQDLETHPTYFCGLSDAAFPGHEVWTKLDLLTANTPHPNGVNDIDIPVVAPTGMLRPDTYARAQDTRKGQYGDLNDVCKMMYSISSTLQVVDGSSGVDKLRKNAALAAKNRRRLRT
jgi:hypothetical protein